MKYLLDANTNIVLVALLIIAVCASCARQVYTYSDDIGESTFTLYKGQYRYEEKTNSSNFQCWGDYKVKDSIIVFTFEKKRMPYYYFLNYAEKQQPNIGKQQVNIQVADYNTKEPIPFASVIAIDSLDNRLLGTETGLDGKTYIFKTENIRYIKTSYLGYAPHKIDYRNFADHDILIEMDVLQPGGTISEGDLVDFIDVLLPYQIDNCEHIEIIKMGDIEYSKDKTASRPK